MKCQYPFLRTCGAFRCQLRASSVYRMTCYTPFRLFMDFSYSSLFRDLMSLVTSTHSDKSSCLGSREPCLTNACKQESCGCLIPLLFSPLRRRGGCEDQFRHEPTIPTPSSFFSPGNNYSGRAVAMATPSRSGRSVMYTPFPGRRSLCSLPLLPVAPHSASRSAARRR